MTIDKSQIGGVILAGGRASRMDYRDKPLQLLHGEPLLAHVIAKASPQVAQVVLSVNHSAELYRAFALPLLKDQQPGYAGPLLGIYSAMSWFATEHDDPNIEYLACFAADVPEFPLNVVSELGAALQRHDAQLSYIQHRDQIQPLFSLWRLSLLDRLAEAIEAGIRGPKMLFDDLHSVAVPCEDESPGCFFNINGAEDLIAAAKLIEKI